MANDNEDQGGIEGTQSEFDKQKKDETGQQGQKPQSGDQPTIGGQQGQRSELGQQGQAETKISDPTGQQGETTQPGAGQEGGFVGTQREESGEYLQEGETGQAGFAEQGRGAPEEGTDIEGAGERKANRPTDTEGSSGNS